MNEARGTDRLSIPIPIQCTGVELTGEVFTEEGRTINLSRAGAAIVLNRKLAPQQEITIRNPRIEREATARIVGQLGSTEDGYTYAITLLDGGVNLWGIHFPPLAEAEKAVGRTLLECGSCQSREVTYLDELQAEVYQLNHQVTRPCPRCRGDTIWKQAEHEFPSERPPRPSAPAPTAGHVVEPKPRTANERKHFRVKLNFPACIHFSGMSEEVTTENVSRGGFCFKSRRRYRVGGGAEVAMPYSRGTGNIFTSARFVNAREIPSEGLTLYGVQYEKRSMETWGGRDLKHSRLP